MVKTIFSNSSKTRSFTPSESESNVFDDHVFFSAIIPILNIEASQLEDLQCYLPVFSSIEKLSSFYDKNWPKLKELFVKQSIKVMKYVDGLDEDSDLEQEEDEPKPENQDLNKDMEANANESEHNQKAPSSPVNLKFNFIDFEPEGEQEDEKKKVNARRSR